MTQDNLKDLLDTNGIDYEESGEELLASCPFCGTDKKKFSINVDKNAAKCWICGESCNTTKAIEALGILDFEKFGEDDEVRASSRAKLKTYLASRGFYSSSEYQGIDKLIKCGRIDFQASVELLSNKGKPFTMRDVVIFKYEGLKEHGYANISHKYKSTFKDAQLRFIHQHTQGAPKYYIPNLKRFAKEPYIVVVEGEEDALTLEFFGINALASTGMQKTDYVADLIGFDKVYFIPDNDSDPRILKQNELAQKKALAAIRLACPDARIYVAKLPSTVKDVNEGLQEYGWGKEDYTKVLAEADEWLQGRLLRSATYYSDDAFSFLADTSKSKGLATGFEGIDRALGGGERLGEIDALVAEAKSGKNSLYHQLIWNRVTSGTPVGYISRELKPHSEVLPNLFSIEFGDNFWALKDKDERKFAKLEQKAREVASKWPLYFADGVGIMSIEEIAQFIKEAKKQGVEYFYFDHFHRAMLDSEDKKEVAKFIHELKTLVSNENVHLNLIVQPTKLPQSQAKISYRNMRGSVAIEQEVDQLWEFHRVDGEDNITCLKLAAARHRLAKAQSKVYFQYDPTSTRMIEVIETIDPEDTVINTAGADFSISQ